MKYSTYKQQWFKEYLKYNRNCKYQSKYNTHSSRQLFNIINANITISNLKNLSIKTNFDSNDQYQSLIFTCLTIKSKIISNIASTPNHTIAKYNQNYLSNYCIMELKKNHNVIYKKVFKKTPSLPEMEQSSLNVGADVVYWFIIPWEWGLGAGILSVMALWNFLLRGSTVTTGDTATPRPRSFAVRSASIVWACKLILLLCVFVLYVTIHFKLLKFNVS